MQQYTTPEQTAKLIELGFEKPKGWNAKNISSRFVMAVDVYANNEFNYSIGELIEMLPECTIVSVKTWHIVQYDKEHYYGRNELIDALYLLIVELKENKII